MSNHDPNRADDTPLQPDGDAVYGRERDDSAGGADSSAWEAAPSGEKQAAANREIDPPA